MDGKVRNKEKIVDPINVLSICMPMQSNHLSAIFFYGLGRFHVLCNCQHAMEYVFKQMLALET